MPKRGTNGAQKATERPKTFRTRVCIHVHIIIINSGGFSDCTVLYSSADGVVYDTTVVWPAGFHPNAVR